jgi:G3E family GTPase
VKKKIRSGSAPLFALIGGFLGAGKTTAIGESVKRFHARGLRCGLITNDQGRGLVDTVLAREQARAVAEIVGGCFCCRLDQLVAAIEKLSAEERPDVLLAEPVGSCTDLVATVLLPLGQVYRLPLRRAPLSVLLDGRRAHQTLVSRGRSRSFSKDVGYIYRKQIEEAEIVVVNKIDLLTAAQRVKLRGQLERDYPGRKVFEISALSGEGIDAWIEEVGGVECEPERIVEMDYQRYGVGEALLGWLNATVSIEAHRSFEGAALLHALVHAVVERLERERIRIAHFKMILTGDDGSSLRVQVTRDGEKPQFAGGIEANAKGAKLLINLRAEGDPEKLAAAVKSGLVEAMRDVPHTIEEFAHFRPGQPKPTHRIAELVA